MTRAAPFGRPLALTAVLLAWPLALSAMPQPAHAQGLGLLDNKSSGPIEIEADDGIEWRQNDKLYIARGNVKVVRAQVTVYADTVTAYYRDAKPDPAKQAAKEKEAKADPTAPLFGGGGTEIWKLDAVGNLRIETQGDQAYAERAVYNVDIGVLTLTGKVRMTSPAQNTTAYGDEAVYDTRQAVMVLTGKDLRFDSPQTKITARDSLEYYDQKNMAVARGEAVAIQADKRVRADVLTAHLQNTRGAQAKTPQTPAAKRAAAGKPAPGAAAAPTGAGGIERIDAFGDVFMSSTASIARGEKGVYTVSTGLAVLTGGVKITRGDNQLNGDMAEVNLNTGISRILSGTPVKATGERERVRALFVPAKAAPPAGASEQMTETKQAPPPDDPARPRLPADAQGPAPTAQGLTQGTSPGATKPKSAYP